MESTRQRRRATEGQPTARLRAPKAPKQPSCFLCWFTQRPCYRGTLSGYCARCGNISESKIPSTVDCWNKVIAWLQVLVLSTTYLSQLTDPCSNSLLEIDVRIPGTYKPCTIPINDQFYPLDPQRDEATHRIDGMVESNVSLKLQGKYGSSDLFSKGTLAGGYLCLIFPRKRALEGTQSTTNQHLQDGENIRRELVKFSVIRFQQLYREVMSYACEEKLGNEFIPDAEATAAFAVLYCELNFIRQRLTDGTAQLLCNDVEGERTLKDWLTALQAQLAEKLRRTCGSERAWAENIAQPPWKALKRNVDVIHISFRIVAPDTASVSGASTALTQKTLEKLPRTPSMAISTASICTTRGSIFSVPPSPLNIPQQYSFEDAFPERKSMPLPIYQNYLKSDPQVIVPKIQYEDASGQLFYPESESERLKPRLTQSSVTNSPHTFNPVEPECTSIHGDTLHLKRNRGLSHQPSRQGIVSDSCLHRLSGARSMAVKKRGVSLRDQATSINTLHPQWCRREGGHKFHHSNSNNIGIVNGDNGAGPVINLNSQFQDLGPTTDPPISSGTSQSANFSMGLFDDDDAPWNVMSTRLSQHPNDNYMLAHASNHHHFPKLSYLDPSQSRGQPQSHQNHGLLSSLDTSGSQPLPEPEPSPWPPLNGDGGTAANNLLLAPVNHFLRGSSSEPTTEFMDSTFMGSL